jgi:S-adenosylmethionine hydrolase
VIIPASVRIAAGETEVFGIVRHYSAAERGTPLALVGSSGFLELAVNAGNAAGTLHLHIGTQINLQIG